MERPLVPSAIEPLTHPPRIDLSDAYQVAYSMELFAQNMDKDKTHDVLKPYIRDSQLHQEGDFSLEYQIRQVGNFFTLNNCTYNQDGKHALILQYRARTHRMPRPIAVVSFSSHSEVASYKNLDYSEDAPLILQLQGPSPLFYNADRKRYKEAIAILQKIRWEGAIIDFVKMWCQEENIPSLYLLPAMRNKWLGLRGGERLTKFHLRYDVSAKRSGFTMRENGYWGIDLSNSPLPSDNHESLQ